MTEQEQATFTTFVFRHANLTLIDYALGHDIFDKVAEQRLNRREKEYFLTLAEAEEKELIEARKEAPSEATRRKIDRLLKNARETRGILMKSR